MSPLLDHKSLRSVGFMDKRHYNMKSKEVDLALEAKSDLPFKEFVSKGQWQTFRFVHTDEIAGRFALGGHGRAPL